MPKLWSDTIDAHRRDLRRAVMDTTWQLVVDHGLLAVTMSRIAQEVGVGRATLYKYFPDVEAVLVARHQEHVVNHLAQLAALRDQAPGPVEGLKAVLTGYAVISRHRTQHGTELMQLLHRGEQINQLHQQLDDLVCDLITAAAAASDVVRTDIEPGELASYCLHALEAASALTTDEAVERLITLVLDGLALRGPVPAPENGPPMVDHGHLSAHDPAGQRPLR